LEKLYDEILDKAKKYLDTRQNDVHVPLSYDFAKRLLKHYPEADGDIVLPAIILHDVGWKMVSEDEQLKSFGPKMEGKEKQHVHELKGLKIAEEILVSFGFEMEKIQEILEIIEGHDTRKESISLNDSLVKDADKLWRYTPIGVEIDHTRFRIERRKWINHLSENIDNLFFTPRAKEMAREALNDAEKES
jgi:HD superfamily phosphodiesterase